MHKKSGSSWLLRLVSVQSPLRSQLLHVWTGETRSWSRASALTVTANSRRHNSNNCNSVTLEHTFKCYDLESGPPTDVDLSREDALMMYTQMLEVRRVETVSSNYYQEKKIRGFCHLYIGQEAVAVGMHARMRKQDSMITAYRCHAWTYLMGVSIYEMMAELLGVRTGCSRGKGGSMHMYADRYYGGNGIVGAQVPVGAGVALAHQYRGDGGVCIACYGDGAANQGQVFEAFNIAKLWCLPCIFVCENNDYGMGTRADRAAASTDFYMRGQYIPGLWVDGNQVLAVRSATQFAIEYALAHGPIVLEMNTYRYVGHSMSDPGTSYRSREEVQTVREKRDPISSFRGQIIALSLATEEELKKLETEVRNRVDADCKKAVKDKEVDLSELQADVYVKNLEPKIRGVHGHHLEHIRISELCLGKPKATPLTQIKNVPVGDAAMVAAAAAAKKAADKAKAERAKAEGKEPPKAPPAAGAPPPAPAVGAPPPAPAAGAPPPPAAAAAPPAAPPAKGDAPKAAPPPAAAPPAKQ
ncbi:probable pyruvate dehydrogenase E1 component subunit alpha, mitochondrial [Drosophila guanche]|uniref:Pyruvate dehydrogenase E1 component subunit alpha n=1 Tax=Drosophila guanche TaxID=7266 RepID=A0A3B0K4S1_DROGU|nr:probable pyruvate dehydrogenase E1 component subunit alpha, mitochondrial [Drosophila guanche]SPP89227.1 blast:Probable pyruvate dehydrogenase E1 component subunit alpha%2C mitochondrial [Drosophila guanche]